MWNWQNSRLGYWLNLILVSGADLGFIFASVLPRYNTLLDGLAGPVLWLLAVIFSTLGILQLPTRARGDGYHIPVRTGVGDIRRGQR